MRRTPPSSPPSASTSWVRRNSPPLHPLLSSFPPSPLPYNISPSFLSCFSLPLFSISPPFSLSLPLFSVSPPLPPENAELMLEEIKQQPCMIERLYGELVQRQRELCTMWALSLSLFLMQHLSLTCTWTELALRYSSSSFSHSLLICPYVLPSPLPLPGSECQEQGTRAVGTLGQLWSGQSPAVFWLLAPDNDRANRSLLYIHYTKNVSLITWYIYVVVEDWHQ